jgi:hypothetical protein
MFLLHRAHEKKLQQDSIAEGISSAVEKYGYLAPRISEWIADYFPLSLDELIH